uniref:TIR domain-containing protein n=1 Tax=Quercus lobata TaxID=97700 RepID=A0A7N2MIW2_QUELO
MGKTSLARVVYIMISNQFEACSFVADVREVYKEYGILQLQQKLLNDLLILRDMNVKDVDNGVSMIKNRLRHKNILLILDDVNELDQLNKLGAKHWLGPGSRVIITTRDMKLLMTHKVDEIYEVEVLRNDEAFHLFNSKDFDKEHPTKDYLELSQAFVHYANGIPLAIEVLGSFLNERSTSKWKSELDRLREFPESKILNVLQISFEGLHKIEKEIFLNIACFFNHKNQETIIAILDCLRLYHEIGLRVLIEKSLIKLQDNQLWIHDLLQEMGRDIVCKECPKDLGKRSRLWLYKDIDNVLTNNMGTETIQGIVLKLPKPKEAHWDPESFSKMHCLKFLIIGNVQSCKTLKFINLKISLKIFETPDFTKIPILEKLVLKDYINLQEIHPSIGVHKKLTLLNLKGCRNLRSLPGKFEMESPKIIILSECSNLKRIPKFGENMKHVSKLYLDDTAITKLPISIGNLTGLSSLNSKRKSDPMRGKMLCTYAFCDVLPLALLFLLQVEVPPPTTGGTLVKEVMTASSAVPLGVEKEPDVTKEVGQPVQTLNPTKTVSLEPMIEHALRKKSLEGASSSIQAGQTSVQTALEATTSLESKGFEVGGESKHRPIIRDKPEDGSVDVTLAPVLQHHTADGNEDGLTMEFYLCKDDPVIQSCQSNRLGDPLPAGLNSLEQYYGLASAAKDKSYLAGTKDIFIYDPLKKFTNIFSLASMSTQGASLLTSSSSSSRRWIYDVFLSFRGKDTRNSFTDHLYVALQHTSIFTFRDNERLERGKSISPELLKAIEESRFAIVILSKTYASSICCLDELTKIIQCMKGKEMTVLPIFYEVDPSNVRK